MRLHRFYINTPVSSDNFDINDKDLVHQWKKVFRYNVGSQVIVFDGSGTDYHCMISSLRNLGATLSVIKKIKTADTASRKNIWLCMAVIKKDNFDLVVQKATELGVNHIVPIVCEHSEKKKINTERMKKIIVEATEQSGRGDIMEIHNTLSLSEIFEKGFLPQEKVVFHPEGISFSQYKNSTNQVSFALFIGPEGGFSDKEINLFKQNHIQMVSMGKQILRAETAGIVSSGLFLIS